MSKAAGVQNSISVSFESGILRIVLARPPLNVLDIPMMRALEDALRSDSHIGDARVLAIRGEGRGFSAGADVADHTPERVDEMLGLFHSVIRSIHRFPVPTVALVHGAALGGGAELACACDLVAVAAGAKLGQPEIKLGVFPPVAMVDLPRSIGIRKAAEMIFTGETLSAREALEAGLVNKIFPFESFFAEAEEYLAKFAALSRSSLVQTKRAFRKVITEPDRAKAMRVAESCYLDDLLATEDAKEGIASFLEKRETVWRHK